MSRFSSVVLNCRILLPRAIGSATSIMPSHARRQAMSYKEHAGRETQCRDGPTSTLTLEQKVDAKLLREIAPVSVRLQNGRQTKIHYERGIPPWVAARFRDLFSTRAKP